MSYLTVCLRGFGLRTLIIKLLGGVDRAEIAVLQADVARLESDLVRCHDKCASQVMRMRDMDKGKPVYNLMEDKSYIYQKVEVPNA